MKSLVHKKQLCRKYPTRNRTCANLFYSTTWKLPSSCIVMWSTESISSSNHRLSHLLLICSWVFQKSMTMIIMIIFIYNITRSLPSFLFDFDVMIMMIVFFNTIFKKNFIIIDSRSTSDNIMFVHIYLLITDLLVAGVDLLLLCKCQNFPVTSKWVGLFCPVYILHTYFYDTCMHFCTPISRYISLWSSK